MGVVLVPCEELTLSSIVLIVASTRTHYSGCSSNVHILASPTILIFFAMITSLDPWVGIQAILGSILAAGIYFWLTRDRPYASFPLVNIDEDSKGPATKTPSATQWMFRP